MAAREYRKARTPTATKNWDEDTDPDSNVNDSFPASSQVGISKDTFSKLENTKW